MVKIALLGVAAVLLALQFKGGKSEYGTYISLAACCLIFYFGTGMLEAVLSGIDKITGFLSIDRQYLKLLLKMIGITYAGEFASSLCKDAGYAAIAGQIELASKFALLASGMPVLLSVLDTVDKFLS